ncbi:hypothetical protein HGRIS_000025 [Hohenbuehelia grisea]|uniref:Uncharacterized protein n=1 Tax=Hohenbuehelia grisea TaxID=104357 RepID=A0ABR3JQW7_9AGAR
MATMNGPAQTETGEANETGSGYQYVRITVQGKMQDFVAFGLKHFERSEPEPLVLHTLPPDLASTLASTLGRSTGQADGASNPSTATKDGITNKKPGLDRATDTIPRLISVAEIIKREYLKTPEALRTAQFTGLYQYNKIGCLEDLRPSRPDPNSSGEDRVAAIIQALDGKNHLKQKQTPYMQITLSKHPLPEHVDNHTSYQPPSIRKMSKSAKARAKKREKKNAQAEIEQAPIAVEGDAIEEDDDE